MKTQQHKKLKIHKSGENITIHLNNDPGDIAIFAAIIVVIWNIVALLSFFWCYRNAAYRQY